MPVKKTAKKVATKKAIKKKLAKVPAKKKNTKSVAKKAPKKSAKKVVKRTVAKRKTSCKKKCRSPHAFWVNNGPVFKTVDGLIDALKEMSDEQFAYHTKRGEGNDFAKWIKECLCDSSCATHLKKVRTRAGAVRVLSSKCACR